MVYMAIACPFLDFIVYFLYCSCRLDSLCQGFPFSDPKIGNDSILIRLSIHIALRWEVIFLGEQVKRNVGIGYKNLM